MRQRYRALLAGTILAGLAAPAGAQGLGLGLGVSDIVVRAGGGPVIYPGDTVAFSAWWGLRAYSSAHKTGLVNAVRLRRASDNLELDIKILTNGDLDVATAAGHCAATSCFASVLYNQVGGNVCSGASCNLVQTTPANQHAFVFNCLGARPCLSSGSTTIILASANNFTPTTGVMSLHYAGARTSGVNGCLLIYANGSTGSRLTNITSSATWAALSAGGTITGAATDGAFHVASGVVNGATSFVAVDGTSTLGTLTNSTLAGTPGGMRGAGTTTCVSLEAGFADAVVFNPTIRQTLSSTTRSYWGMP